jgi:hypothetical protein
MARRTYPTSLDLQSVLVVVVLVVVLVRIVAAAQVATAQTVMLNLLGHVTAKAYKTP